MPEDVDCIVLAQFDVGTLERLSGLIEILKDLRNPGGVTRVIFGRSPVERPVRRFFGHCPNSPSPEMRPYATTLL
ncbi:MAG: hypothetical protein ABIS39_00720 [Sphingomicrobium sp.]